MNCVFVSTGEAPPDYLAPNPPVVSKVFKHSRSLPSLPAVEQLVTNKDSSPMLLVKGKAPLPPSDNRPPVPKRSPMRRSLSDNGGVIKPQDLVFDKNTNINKTCDRSTQNVSYKSTSPNKEKFFSIKKVRSKNSVSDLVPQKSLSPTFSGSERNHKNDDVVDGYDQMKAQFDTDNFNFNKSHISSPVDSSTTTANKPVLLPSISVNNNKKQVSSSLPVFYLPSTFDSSNVPTAPVYCPVYSKPSRLSKNLDVNSNSCELKVDALLSPVLSKKLSVSPSSRVMPKPAIQVLTLEGVPLGTESLV